MWVSRTYLPGNEPKVTSLCPALTKKYSVLIPGMCPSNLQNPRGKVIPISVIGVYPYVVYGEDKEWVGGTEFQVIDVYAKKFGFTPKLMRATGYDNEGSVVDMVRKIHLHFHIIFLGFFLTG